MALHPGSMEIAAFQYLRRFPSSTENLRRVLWRKARRGPDFAPATEPQIAMYIEMAVQKMIDAGLLDDEAYSKALCQSLHTRGKPLRAIGHKLREKGLSPEVIDAALRNLAMDGDVHPDLMAAWSFAKRKKLGPYRGAPVMRKAHEKKDLAAFARAGFSYSRAKEVLDSAECPFG